jgi:DNA replication licensing factor MCM7
MALREFKAPVNYESQERALAGFLKDFKTSPEQTLTTALGDITIGEDELEDEYDFMDDDEQANDRRREEREQRRQPRHIYKEMLQKLANRVQDTVVIDLDDLATVCLSICLSTSCPWQSSQKQN